MYIILCVVCVMYTILCVVFQVHPIMCCVSVLMMDEQFSFSPGAATQPLPGLPLSLPVSLVLACWHVT
jgi:hypothetical protein